MTTTLDAPVAPTTTDTDLDAQFADIVGKEEKVVDDGMGDAERFSHYVSKEDIVRSSMTGNPVRALCGKMWTPSKSPEGLPVCPECKDAYEKMRDE